jgi:hypothetical protein
LSDRIVATTSSFALSNPHTGFMLFSLLFCG